MGKNSQGVFLRVRWSYIAVACLIVAIGSVGALVVVATIEKADALATIALALAVLAFVIQILVFVAQTAAATAQQRETLTINAETRSILAELRTHAVETNQVVTGQFNKLLDRFILDAKNSVAEATEDSGSAEEAVQAVLASLSSSVEELRRSVERELPTRPRHGESGASLARTSSNPALRERNLSRAKSGPVKSIANRLAHEEGLPELDADAVALLARFADDVIVSGEASIAEGLPVSMDVPGLNTLRALYLITRRVSGSTETSDPLYRLTGKGRALASAITGSSVDDGLLSALPWLSEARSRYRAS
ncbi:MAG TPA: hypothetical protein VHU91_08415 [Mycobacteriales bacterium]|nr:hypothetical protein [Mycobacteriales bacterium]